MTPASGIATRFPWTEDLLPWSPGVIAWLEVAGSVGLLAPQATGLVPVLTTAAGGGLALTMGGAVPVRVVRGECAGSVSGLALLAMCPFAAYGRLTVHPPERRAYDRRFRSGFGGADPGRVNPRR